LPILKLLLHKRIVDICLDLEVFEVKFQSLESGDV
jgi:hypothetical protein